MKAEELITQLKNEISEKKKLINILEANQIFLNLKKKDIRIQINKHPKTGFSYYVAYVKNPLVTSSNKLMTKSLGNVWKTNIEDPRVINRVIRHFKKKWETKRLKFDILKKIN
jgi:hypothetical protein